MALEDSFEIDDLARRYAVPLARYFRARVRSAADIDDMVQEVFLRLAERREGGTIEAPESYLFPVAASVLSDSFNMAARRHPPVEEARHADVGANRRIPGMDELPRALRVDAARPKAGIVALAASLAALAAAGVGALMVHGEAIEQREQVYRTAAGERASVILSDGSRLLLNSASEVKVEYAAGRRTLQLVAGEAWFDAAKDPKRPFVVGAGRHMVTTEGASFDVQQEPAGLRVVVVEGRVAVGGAGGKHLTDVRAGERMDVSGNTAVLRPSAPSAGDWRDAPIG